MLGLRFTNHLHAQLVWLVTWVYFQRELIVLFLKLGQIVVSCKWCLRNKVNIQNFFFIIKKRTKSIAKLHTQVCQVSVF